MIDTQAIRNKILDLAIRGKLTEQLPQDGTAEELYQQIQAEKAALIKDGKIKKSKPLPEITEDEIPFDIPPTWKWVRLGDICSKVVDGDHNPPAGINERTDYLMLSAQNVENDGITALDSVRYLTPEVFARENLRTNLEPGDILLTIVGALGRSCIYEGGLNACFQRSVSVITTLAYNRYVKRVLDSPLIQKQIKAGATGSAQLGFYLAKVNELIIPLPPLDVQVRIVETINPIFQLLADLDDLQRDYADDSAVLKSKIIDAGIRGELTEQLPQDGTAEELHQQIQAEKAALIKDGKIKKQKPLPEITEDEIPFDIPPTWKWVRWGEIVNIVSARRVHQSDWRKQGIPFYRAREIARLADNGFVDNDLYISEELFEEFSVSGVPSEGDLMVSAVGTLGKTYVVKEHDKFYYKDASVLCFENFAHINPHYLKLVMDSGLMQRQIENNSGGTTVDTLTMVRTLRYVLPLPPLAEQKRIVKRIEELLAAMPE